MTREIVVLVNPVAGRQRGARLVRPVAERLREAGLQADVQEGRDAAEAGDLARAAVQRGVDGLVLIGGDGMVRLALDAVAGGTTPLGIIPAGTGNDLARALGIPRRDPLAAADLVVAGHTRVFDLGRAGSHWFGTIVCAGFDSRVADRVASMRWPRGRRRYDLATIAELGIFKPLSFALELDGEEWQTEAMLVAVGNTSSYGGGLRICADADPMDGLLDVSVIAPVSVPQLLRMFPKLSKGTHTDHPALQTRRVKRVSIAGPSVTPYADGDPFVQLPLTVESVPGALPVFVPPRV